MLCVADSRAILARPWVFFDAHIAQEWARESDTSGLLSAQPPPAVYFTYPADLFVRDRAGSAHDVKAPARPIPQAGDGPIHGFRWRSENHERPGQSPALSKDSRPVCVVSAAVRGAAGREPAAHCALARIARPASRDGRGELSACALRTGYTRPPAEFGQARSRSRPPPLPPMQHAHSTTNPPQHLIPRAATAQAGHSGRCVRPTRRRARRVAAAVQASEQVWSASAAGAP